MSQQRFDEAKQVIVKLYEEIQGKEPCKLASRHSEVMMLIASRRESTCATITTVALSSFT